jgi:hypothetical protein
LSHASEKPLLIWVGGGASSWLGYERWADLAERFHATYLKRHSNYKREEAARDLVAGDYPALFQRCFDADPQHYASLLAGAFGTREITPVYARFLNALRQIEGVSIVSTNVDETLERSLSKFDLVQRTDLARTTAMVASRTPFIAKLHGTVSFIKSTIFTTDDYRVLTADDSYTLILRWLLTTCYVIFIGYRMRD